MKKRILTALIDTIAMALPLVAGGVLLSNPSLLFKFFGGTLIFIGTLTVFVKSFTMEMINGQLGVLVDSLFTHIKKLTTEEKQEDGRFAEPFDMAEEDEPNGND